MFRFILPLTLSYFLGSLPTAYLVGKKVKGLDIRKHGSGNVGATNVFRVVGKGWGIAVLFLDAFKGALAVSLVPRLFSDNFFLLPLLCGIAAILGHTWNLWLGCKGGKGVATSAGVFFALAPKAAAAALVVWVLVFTWKRYVSLASIVTAAVFPVWVFLFYRKEEKFLFLFPISLLLFVFILCTHQGNIKRLREGAEKRLL